MANHTHGTISDEQRWALIGEIVKDFPKNLPKDRAQDLLTKPKERRQGLHQFLFGMSANPVGLPAVVSRAYPLGVVKYSQGLRRMARNAKFTYLSEDLNSQNYPLTHIVSDKVYIESYVIHFNRDVTDVEAKAEIEKMGLTCATPYELVVFAKKYKELRAASPIVALGQVWRDSSDGEMRVACIDTDDSLNRRLRLYFWKEVWGPKFRFLAFRVVSAEYV